MEVFCLVFLTGDTHGEFERIEEFCEEYETTTDDVMVILGDAGINYYLNARDIQEKERLSQLNITLFCVHGNHEERPENVIDADYAEKDWHGGLVWVEEEFPNILFAKDGEIYDIALDGKTAIVIGGAYSVDKYYRISGGAPWFDSEQPDETIKAYVETQLEKVNWKVDYIFSHTTPFSYMPHEEFLSNIDQKTVDNSTEVWLDQIEQKLDYDRWYAGHFHTTKSMGKIQILYEDYVELDSDWY